MRKKIKAKNKKGAASFYIIAFSTLILVIIAASFAAIIISEVTRTTNDDLAQSAYDSALAGVEDAKLAFYNYQNCQSVPSAKPDMSVSGVSCGEIVYWMEHQQDCDMVAHILGRIGKGESGEVMVQESKESGNNMQQAYTCVKMASTLDDYRGTLSSSNQYKVIRARFDTENNVHASDVKYMKISWYSDANSSVSGTNYNMYNNGKVTFPPIGASGGGPVAPKPTVLSVGLIQTSESFSMSDFDFTVGGNKTNRATVFLVPAGSSDPNKAVTIANKLASDNGSGEPKDTYISAYNGSGNKVTAKDVAKSNDKTRKNLPFVVYCDELNDFACSTTIELPEPVNGKRNDDTFAVVVSLPYGTPNTDFAVEFYCDEGKQCGETTTSSDSGTTVVPTNRAKLKWVQIGVDSTGRANDLYRRVETRLEGSNAFSLSSLGVLEILGGGNDTIWKNFSVATEYNF